MNKFRFNNYSVPEDAYRYGTVYDALTELDPEISSAKLHPNSQVFSKLFKTIPELSKFYSNTIGYHDASNEYDLYSLQYKTVPLVFRHLIELYQNEGLVPAELIWRQKLTAFPSNTAVVLDPSDSYLSRVSYIAENLTSQEQEPDIRLATQYTRYPDENVSTALALMLTQQDVYQPESNNRVKNPTDLKYFEEQYPGLKIDFDELHLGFHRLVTRLNMATLNNAGIIQRTDHELFYTRVAAWQMLSAVHATRNSRNDTLSFPFVKDKTTTNVEEYPVPGFLPYAFVALYHYIDALPDYLPEGKGYELPSLITPVRRLYDFAYEVLKYNVSTEKITKAEANDTWEELTDFEENFKAIYSEYIKKPELLNRRPPKLIPTTKTINEIRAEILHAGGKARKKPFLYRFRNQARRGDI